VCLLSAPTVLFNSSTSIHSSEGGELSTRPHVSDVVCVCVCVGGSGIIAEDWGVGLYEEAETPTEAALHTNPETVYFNLSSVIFLSDSQTTMSTKP